MEKKYYDNMNLRKESQYNKGKKYRQIIYNYNGEKEFDIIDGNQKLKKIMLMVN